MSKRAGDFVTLREVIDEVGRDAIRFMDAHGVERPRQGCGALQDNLFFYVQYGHGPHPPTGFAGFSGPVRGRGKA
jgi:arginyl-tRNA synthetase